MEQSKRLDYQITIRKDGLFCLEVFLTNNDIIALSKTPPDLKTTDSQHFASWYIIAVSTQKSLLSHLGNLIKSSGSLSKTIGEMKGTRHQIDRVIDGSSPEKSNDNWFLME